MTKIHHWAQGPMDVRQLPDETVLWGFPRRWEFRYWIEGPLALAPLTAETVFQKCDWVLNEDQRSWGARLGIHFRRVEQIDDCDIVLRFSNGPPPDWPNLVGSGWYYWDNSLRKNVAHVTARAAVFNHTALFNYILGMELVGHGTLRMWDMYITAHQPYVGVMGSWTEAALNDGWPTDAEIEDGLAWLSGHAYVDQHPEFGAPTD